MVFVSCTQRESSTVARCGSDKLIKVQSNIKMIMKMCYFTLCCPLFTKLVNFGHLPWHKSKIKQFFFACEKGYGKQMYAKNYSNVYVLAYPSLRNTVNFLKCYPSMLFRPMFAKWGRVNNCVSSYRPVVRSLACWTKIARAACKHIEMKWWTDSHIACVIAHFYQQHVAQCSLSLISWRFSFAN